MAELSFDCTFRSNPRVMMHLTVNTPHVGSSDESTAVPEVLRNRPPRPPYGEIPESGPYPEDTA